VTAGAGLHYESYADGEWMLRIGDPGAPPILFVPPLLEEMNRTRALIAGVMRRLAARDFACWLPDLPGTGESERALEDCGWDDWREAVRSVGARLGKPPLVSLRGGCLLDDAAEAVRIWRFAPVEGASLARDLARSGLVGGGSAGYALASSLIERLEAAKLPDIGSLRTVRLTSDRAEADAKLEGPALWRRSEPGNAPALADAMAADIESWVGQCGG